MDKMTDEKVNNTKSYLGFKDLICPAIILGIILIITKFVLFIASTESGSMEPTLPVGFTTIYSRLAYMNNDIQRGDIISFFSHELGKNMAKRVIGISGDEICFRDGYVIANGQCLDETAYLDSDIETNCLKEFKVPEGYVFVLGDNREDSFDSRYWNNPYISIDDIQGKYMYQIPFSL